MLQRTSNQTKHSPPLVAHNHHHGVVSQHLSSLINTTELLVQEFPPSACLPATICLSALLLFLRSPPFLSLLFLLSSQQDSPPSGRSCQASEDSGWKCDNNTTKMKTPGQERSESGRMKNAKSTFRLVGVLWSPRGPIVRKNRWHKDAGWRKSVCLTKGQKKVNLGNVFQKKDYCNEKRCF